MPRRVNVPTVDDLFRPTVVPDPAPEPATGIAPVPGAADPGTGAAKAASGRVRHDEKVTVYVTSEELFDIEAARLTLRRDHTLRVDRGRLVRAAVSLALEGLESEGAGSPLVQRLSRD